MLNNNAAFKGYSQYQKTVNKGQLMHFYRETLLNLSVDSNGKSPNFFYDDYINWNFITLFRTSVLPAKLDYLNQLPDVTLPRLHTGAYKMQYNFKKPTVGPPQTCYIVSIFPALMSCEYDRKIELSYTHN